MITVTKIGTISQEAIDKGNAFKDTQNIAFLDREEAEDWAIHHYGHGEYDLLELCGECEEGTYRDEPSNKYKTRKRIVKRVKIVKLL